MTREERAAQFWSLLWSLLVLDPRTQHVLSYGLMERLTGIPKQAVGQILGPLQEYCKRNALPPLTSLVVNERDGLPGEGFTEAKDIFGTQARVFVYDWLGHDAPSREDFKF